MALTAAQLEKYGLSKSDASSADHDKGIVGYKGSFYSIDDFDRQQKKGLDTDQGSVFSSSLYDDAKKKGFSVSNFNTATDVEGALEALGGVKEEDPAPVEDPGPVVHSPKLAHARARVAQMEEDRVSGQIGRDLYGGGEDPANTFLDRYKLKLGDRLENGYYIASDQPVNNSSRVASGANEQSVDSAYYSKTGKDNRYQ